MNSDIRENKWQYLLLVIKFYFSQECLDFGKLVFMTMSLTLSWYLEISGDINESYFFK